MDDGLADLIDYIFIGAGDPQTVDLKLVLQIVLVRLRGLKKYESDWRS